MAEDILRVSQIISRMEAMRNNTWGEVKEEETESITMTTIGIKGMEITLISTNLRKKGWREHLLMLIQTTANSMKRIRISISLSLRMRFLAKRAMTLNFTFSTVKMINLLKKDSNWKYQMN